MSIGYWTESVDSSFLILSCTCHFPQQHPWMTWQKQLTRSWTEWPIEERLVLAASLSPALYPVTVACTQQICQRQGHDHLPKACVTMVFWTECHYGTCMARLPAAGTQLPVPCSIAARSWCIAPSVPLLASSSALHLWLLAPSQGATPPASLLVHIAVASITPTRPSSFWLHAWLHHQTVPWEETMDIGWLPPPRAITRAQTDSVHCSGAPWCIDLDQAHNTSLMKLHAQGLFTLLFIQLAW
jgi:hypothetical protein